MAEITLQIAGGFYTNQSKPIAGQACVNFIPKIMESDGTRTPTALYTQGIETWLDTLSGIGRGWVIFQKELHAIQGTDFIKVDSLGVITVLGTIPSTEQCFLAENGETVAITNPEGPSYFYGTDIGVLEINAINFGASGSNFVDFGQATSVVEKDGFFIFTTDDIFFKSRAVTQNKGRDFDALDFSTAEISTDQVLSALVVHNELHITGTRTIELYQAIDTTAFPYQRIPGAHVEKGLTGRYAVTELSSTYAYIGGSSFEATSVWAGTSGDASKISSDAIDTLLAKYTEEELQGVIAWNYSFNGSFFAAWTLPDTTIVYDATASSLTKKRVWHERKTANSQWAPNRFLNIYGRILCQSSVDGKIGAVSDQIYSEYDLPVDRSVVTSYTHDQGKRLIISSIELFFERDISDDPVNQVEILMEISVDGGKTFQSRGTRRAGRPGDTTKRLVWRQQGKAEQDFSIRFSTTSDRKIIFEKAVMNVNPTR